MSTKLNAQELAAEWLRRRGMWPEQMSSRINLGDTSPTMVEAFADFAQPLAEEAAEYRDALEEAMKTIAMHAAKSASMWTTNPDLIADNVNRALAPYRAILDKYPKP